MSEEKFIEILQKCYFGDRDAFNEIVAIFKEKEKENKRLKEVLEVKSYCKYANKCNEIYDCTKEEYNDMVLSNCELGVKLDCSLEMLAEWGPPCELDGFMDKHSDYCEKNCSVDEEVFKKCWLMYIKDKLKDEVE